MLINLDHFQCLSCSAAVRWFQTCLFERTVKRSPLKSVDSIVDFLYLWAASCIFNRGSVSTNLHNVGAVLTFCKSNFVAPNIGERIRKVSGIKHWRENEQSISCLQVVSNPFAHMVQPRCEGSAVGTCWDHIFPSQLLPWSPMVSHGLPWSPYKDGTPKKAAQSTAQRRSSALALLKRSKAGSPAPQFWNEAKYGSRQTWIIFNHLESSWIILNDLEWYWIYQIPKIVDKQVQKEHCRQLVPTKKSANNSCTYEFSWDCSLQLPLRTFASQPSFKPRRCHHGWTPTVGPFDPRALAMLTWSKIHPVLETKYIPLAQDDSCKILCAVELQASACPTDVPKPNAFYCRLAKQRSPIPITARLSRGQYIVTTVFSSLEEQPASRCYNKTQFAI